MIITKQMQQRAEELIGPCWFGVPMELDAATVEQVLKLVRDMAPESPEDEAIKRELIAQGNAALAEVTK